MATRKSSDGKAKPAHKDETKAMMGSINFTPYKEKKGEEYMSDAMQEHFRSILRQWKEQLMKEMQLTAEHLQTEPMSFADPVDRASQEEGFSLELRARDRERKLIKKIDQAIAAIDIGEYGYCEDCGAEIGLRRLEARPTAGKCIDCKTFQEIREKQEGN